MWLGELTKDQARYIARRLREGDRREAFALRATNPDDLAREVVEGYRDGVNWCAALERPIAMGGVAELWPGVWEGWMLATDEFPAIGLPMTKWIKATVMPALKKAGCHRWEVKSIATHDNAHRWLEVLGFEREAVLKAYGRGREDFVVYRWE